MPSYAITGASRGIGFELVRQLAAIPSNTVLAIVRDPESPAIKNLAYNNVNVHTIEGNVTDPESLVEAAAATSKITDGKLDVLIHNANAVDQDTLWLKPSQVPLNVVETEALFDPSIRTAIYGPLWMTNAFLSLIKNGTEKKIVYLSSDMADLDFIKKTGISYAMAYSIAKAGMNVAAAKYAAEFKAFAVVALSPGWVDTWDGEKPPQLAEKNAELLKAFQGADPDLVGQMKPEESVRMLLVVIGQLNANESGSFLGYRIVKEWWQQYKEGLRWCNRYHLFKPWRN